MKDGSRETPFLVSGNGGDAVSKLTHKGAPTVRTPFAQPSLSDGTDNMTLENYDDADFGYLRVIVNAQQLRIEYHPASDGEDSKTPDDFVTWISPPANLCTTRHFRDSRDKRHPLL